MKQSYEAVLLNYSRFTHQFDFNEIYGDLTIQSEYGAVLLECHEA